MPDRPESLNKLLAESIRHYPRPLLPAQRQQPIEKLYALPQDLDLGLVTVRHRAMSKLPRLVAVQDRDPDTKRNVHRKALPSHLFVLS
jgi:hypothetical protein